MPRFRRRPYRSVFDEWPSTAPLSENVIEIERLRVEAEAAAERERTRLKLGHQYVEGARFLGVELVERDWQYGIHGKYSNGKWRARCAHEREDGSGRVCGVLVIVTTRELRELSPRTRGCDRHRDEVEREMRAEREGRDPAPGVGRPRLPESERCPCGRMSRARAQVQYHHCRAQSADTPPAVN